MSGWVIYWVLILDEIWETCNSIACLLLLFVIAGWIYYAFCPKKFKQKCKRCCFWITIIFAIAAMGATFIPKTKQAVLIYVIPKIVNNEQIQQIPDKLLEIANKQLDEWINEFSE